MSPRYVVDKIGVAVDDDGRIDIRTDGTCGWSMPVVSVPTQVLPAYANMPTPIYVSDAWQGYRCYSVRNIP